MIPDLIVHDGCAFASSLDVARVFKKRHDDVVRKLRNIVRDEPAAARSFAASEYIDPTGRKLPCFEITRDGFTLLGMGFTGKIALGFKLAYIAKFNAMETELRARAESDAFALPPPESLTFEQVHAELSRFGAWLLKAMDRRFAAAAEHAGLTVDDIDRLMSGRVGRAVGGSVKRTIANEQTWRGAGLLPMPLPNDETTFVTATEACWHVIPDNQMHPKLPNIIGVAVVQHARDHVWPQGSTPRRSRSHRPMPTYPLSRVKEWLAAGAADFIRDENARLHREAAAFTQGVIQFPDGRGASA